MKNAPLAKIKTISLLKSVQERLCYLRNDLNFWLTNYDETDEKKSRERLEDIEDQIALLLRLVRVKYPEIKDHMKAI